MCIQLPDLPRATNKQLEPLFLLGITLLFFWTLLRGFRLPLDYVVGHWLLDYDHGFVKRGLVGALISPLLQYKSPFEIRLVIEVLSIVVLLALGAALTLVIRSLVYREHGGRLLGVLPATVFATSSFPVVAAGQNGGFDHFLEILTLAAIWAVVRRRYLIVPVLCLAALAVHELFIVYGFPVVVLATLLRSSADVAKGFLSTRRRFFVLALTVLPPILFYLSILFSQYTTPPRQIEALGADIAATGVFTPRLVHDLVLFQLQKDLKQNYEMQKENSFWPRVTNSDIGLEVFPSTLFLLLWTVVILWTARRRLMILPAFGVTLAPLVTHLVAWDTHRFTNFTVFQSFGTLFAVVAVLKPSVRCPRWCVTGTLLLFATVIAHNLLTTVHLTYDHTEQNNILALRRSPTLASFDGRPRLFPNSDFESNGLRNWTVTGSDMLRKPKNVYIPEFNVRQAMVQGNRWYGTYSMSKRNNQYLGDLPQGEMVSRPFVITQNEILFLVSGGKHPRHTYVALEVDDKEIYRAWGENDDLFRPTVWDVNAYRGRQAIVRVVDKTSGPWGHINVDGFCYSPG